MNVVITNAGRQAVVNSAQTGLNAVTIAQIGVGSGRYTPLASQTSLQAEIKRLPIVEGGSAGDNSIHVAYQDDSEDAYTIYEFGLYLNDGTLFAVYSSQTETVLQKSGVSSAVLAIDIALGDINTTDISFGDVTFTTAAATTGNAGVLAIATAEEVQAGVETQKAITPANIRNLTATTERVGLVKTATSDEAVAGTDSTLAITPATAKAIVDSRMATSAETISGTSSTKAVTPASLKTLTATTARPGIVEMATEAEAIAGTDELRAVSPAVLNAVINQSIPTASESVKGIVELATTTEAAAGTDTSRAVTPAGVKQAITSHTGAINSATVTATGATTARTLAARFADGITPKDFGAQGNGAVNDQAAFTALEAKVTGRDVDLEGLTYLVTTRPVGNNYYNGYFKIGGETVKPVYDFYKFGGTAERFINIKRDFTDTERGGGALLAGNYVRSGTSAGAVVQSAAWDDVNRYLYTLHTTSGDLGVVNRFSTMKMGGLVRNLASAYTAASAYVGHQGLGVQHMDDGAVKLWASMAYEAAGAAVTSKGTKAVRFDAPTGTGQNIDSSVEIFNLFPEVDGSNQATTVCISYSGKYLIAKYSVNGTNDYRVRIFKLDDLTEAGDYSNKYIHEFTITLTRDTDIGGIEKALQGMACDDRYIYFLAAYYGYGERHSIYVSDMFGNVVDEYRDLSLGKEIGVYAGTTYYEPESLFFMSLNGQPKLVMQIATGDVEGNRLCHLIAINARQSYFFPVGSGYGSHHAVAIDEQARVVNAEGRANFSLYPSGLSQDLLARAGVCQRTQARFTDDAVGCSYVMYKSRGTSVSESLSAVAGDVIGQIGFYVDNGNIDYLGTVQGARAAFIEGGVFESSTLTSAGTTNVGVRGYIRLYACDDANSRNGQGIEVINNSLRPTADDALNLGTAGRRWKAIFAMTDVVSTSDENQKQDIADIPDAVLDAWGAVNFKQFRFISDVSNIEDKSTIYCGVIAQQVMTAFEAAGLDACAYGLVCADTDDTGATVYGVRYREALVLESAYQRKKMAELEARIAALESA